MSDSLKTVYDDLDFATGRIGEQTRSISLGVLAIAWLFLAGGKDAPAVATAPNVVLLLSAGALSVASLLADYFQYLFAYFTSRKVLSQAEADPSIEPQYDYNAFTFRARLFFFWLKQLACLFATALLLIAIVKALIGV